jgi:HSP20 family protein
MPLYRSLFPRDVFAELDLLQREMQQALDFSPNIRGLGRGGFPALNVGGTAQSVEIYAFTPGLDPKTLEVNLDRGVLTIAGERNGKLPADDEKAAVHIHERFAGRFRRVVSLPDDVDPNGVSAEYRDGVLHVTVKRREEAQPRRISIH